MKRAGLLLTLIGLLAAWPAAPASAQSMRIVGFGDSVTFGFPFDVGGGSNCKPSDPDTCGYLPRLASAAYFDCKASKCDFVNRGLSGEKTTEGLTRIDKVLNERPWDVMIIMQGTNDISSNVSPQTVAFNLRAMANKVEKRDVNAVQASIIWLNASFEREGMNNRNLLGDNLSTLIEADAVSQRRCFVDTRSQMCPRGSSQQSCFDKNYWNPPPPEEDFVGHPNGKGYNLLAKEFHRVLGAAGEPGAAEIVSPAGLACGKQAKLTWTKETVAGTTCGNWFRVQIDGPKGNLLDRWYSEGFLCSGTDCTLVSPINFDDDTAYSIRIRTRNTRGYGPWTKEESFTIIPSRPKVVRKLSAPIGDFFNTGGLAADFSWTPTTGSDSYRVELVSKSSGVIFDDSFDADAICDESTCTASLGDPLSTGEYTWRVLAENVCGGGWSDPQKLTVFSSTPQAVPATLAPAARIFDSTPTLRWEPVFGATEFEVEGPFGTSIVSAADACFGGVCRLTTAALAPGPHSWRVRAVNPLGAGAWSSTIAFEVAACDCFEGRAAGGASFQLAVPEAWNGDLVIWAHGSNYFGVKEVEAFSPLAQRQFDEGAALAATSYSVTGWPLFKSERDLEKLYSAFVARYGEPTNVYLAGESVGALVAVAAVETASLGNLVGALAACGPLAGVPNWEPVLDLRLAYDAICGEVRGAAIEGAAKGLPKPNNLEPIDVRNAVNVCTGVDFKRPERSSNQKERLEELLAINDLPESALQDAMFQATFGFSDLVRDKRKLKGRLPVGNDGVDYGSAAINSLIQRASANAKSASKLAKNYQPSGEIGDTKIISLHTDKDPIFYVENQRNFADLAPATGLTLGIVEESEPSHCGFSEVEQLASWRALKIWAEGGKKPKPKNLLKRCRGLRSVAPGECRFDKRPKLDPIETRIRPRP